MYYHHSESALLPLHPLLKPAVSGLHRQFLLMLTAPALSARLPLLGTQDAYWQQATRGL